MAAGRRRWPRSGPRCRRRQSARASRKWSGRFTDPSHQLPRRSEKPTGSACRELRSRPDGWRGAGQERCPGLIDDCDRRVRPGAGMERCPGSRRRCPSHGFRPRHPRARRLRRCRSRRRPRPPMRTGTATAALTTRTGLGGGRRTRGRGIAARGHEHRDDHGNDQRSIESWNSVPAGLDDPTGARTIRPSGRSDGACRPVYPQADDLGRDLLALEVEAASFEGRVQAGGRRRSRRSPGPRRPRPPKPAAPSR